MPLEQASTTTTSHLIVTANTDVATKLVARRAALVVRLRVVTMRRRPARNVVRCEGGGARHRRMTRREPFVRRRALGEGG